MEHNIWVQVISLVGSLLLGVGATAAYGRRGSAGGGGFLVNQGKSRITSAVGRSNNRDANASEAEGILLETAKMSIDDRQKAHEQARDALKVLADMNYRLGKAEAKAELLEKQVSSTESSDKIFNDDDMTSNSTFPEAAEAFAEGASQQDSVLPPAPESEAATTTLDVLPKSQRKPHLFAENRDELEKDNWDISKFREHPVSRFKP
jgi:hypothetical protein